MWREKRRALIETDYSFNYEANEEGIPPNKGRKRKKYGVFTPPETIGMFIFWAVL